MVCTLPLEHPLGGAYARAHRAGEHLADLRHLVEAFWKTRVHHVLTDFNPKIKQVSMTVEKLDPPPVAAAIRCGEVIWCGSEGHAVSDRIV
jgi:hypothetical protein